MGLKKIEKQKINPKQMQRNYCDRVHNELESKGVDFFRPAEDNGSLHINKQFLTLPPNITDVPMKELGEYLNAFTQQKAYLRTLLGWAEMYAEDARLKYMEASAKPYRALLDTKLSETAKDREVNSNEKVKPFFEEWLDNKNKVKLISYNITSIEDIIFMLSREMTRRTGDFKEENRNYNVSRK